MDSDNCEAYICPSEYPSELTRRFRDGKRTVDFVLAYNNYNTTKKKEEKRNVFEENLQNEGLQLERDTTQWIHFVKVHAPKEVLNSYSEILKIKLPLKSVIGQSRKIDDECCFLETIKSVFSGSYFLELDKTKFPPQEQRTYCEFSRNYMDLFDWENPNFFNDNLRSSIINFILERQHFVRGKELPDNLGIEKLLTDEVYDAVYPLHNEEEKELLLNEWATVRKVLTYQPLDKVKEYFGPKVAIYYAWLGFYTNMLIPLSIIGVLCFVYGLATLGSDTISKEICSDNTTLMCPQCDKLCDYWPIQQICFTSKMNYLIDNRATVVFAFILSMWAILYLELWKRYSARLIHQWGLTGFSHEIEHPRPQYLSKIKKTPSPIKEKKDFNFENKPFWIVKFLSDLTSYSITILLISASLIAFFSINVYRLSQNASMKLTRKMNKNPHNEIIYRLTAGIIDLTIISLLDCAYSRLAVYLTNLEFRRTQTEYDESLTVKNYVFQFVNYYTSLFYIAFLKGKYVGYPGHYIRILGFRQEECAPGGCLAELCMKLVIIMVGKQAVNEVIEMTIPYVKNVYNKYRTNYGANTQEELAVDNQWAKDYHLTLMTHSSLYSEYLEMVLQFGFITLFGLAFPLAPLLALINNVIEMRLDAFKMLRYFKRPVAQRVRNIGVWYNIMAIISKIAVASSAMIIAFSTNLIPKLIYLATNDLSLEGYLNFTLAHFNTEDFQVKLETSLFENVTTCRYSEFRNPPTPKEGAYDRSLIYWEIFTARLAFVVIFQYIVGVIQAFVAWSIPDVPRDLRKQIKKEDFHIRENLIEYEKAVPTNIAPPIRSLTPFGDDRTPFLNQHKSSLYNRRQINNNEDQISSF